ncbi:MAG: Flp pilus assembly complex ATPase component TadA, partial [Lachnospiraceae bacterium]|nr:Flp pilus assembly complex ATPase component TadA [Lachnospiraceae bacterium]
MEHDIRESLRTRLLDRMDYSRDIDDSEILEMIREEVMEEGHSLGLGVNERIHLEKELYNSLRKLDVLQDLLEDEDITEIMINGPNDIFIEKNGIIMRSTKHFTSDEKLFDVIQQIVAVNNKVVNESSPIVDTRLSDGSRINIILPPIAIDHAVISIRRFPKEQITMKKLLELGSLTEEMASLLKILVISGYNIFCSGGTGSGKTTFLNALTEF